MGDEKTARTTKQDQGKPQSGSESVLTDKEKFEHQGSDEKLRHMGEKARETREKK